MAPLASTASTSDLVGTINSVIGSVYYGVTTLGIIVGGVWFFVSRKGRYVLQMSIALRGVAIWAGKPIPIVRVTFKNVGRTSIQREEGKVFIWDYTRSNAPLAYDKGSDLRLPRTHIEPGDEIFEDVPCQFGMLPDVYAVRVVFEPQRVWKFNPFSRRPADWWKWETTALFYKDQPPEVKAAPNAALPATVVDFYYI